MDGAEFEFEEEAAALSSLGTISCSLQRRLSAHGREGI